MRSKQINDKTIAYEVDVQEAEQIISEIKKHENVMPSREMNFFAEYMIKLAIHEYNLPEQNFYIATLENCENGKLRVNVIDEGEPSDLQDMESLENCDFSFPDYEEEEEGIEKLHDSCMCHFTRITNVMDVANILNRYKIGKSCLRKNNGEYGLVFKADDIYAMETIMSEFCEVQFGLYEAFSHWGEKIIERDAIRILAEI